MSQNADSVCVGFTVNLTIKTDDIPDLIALGRKLRNAEDGGGEHVNTKEEAEKEVAYLFGSWGTNHLTHVGGVYAEMDDVRAEATFGAAHIDSSGAS